MAPPPCQHSPMGHSLYHLLSQLAKSSQSLQLYAVSLVIYCPLCVSSMNFGKNVYTNKNTWLYNNKNMFNSLYMGFSFAYTACFHTCVGRNRILIKHNGVMGWSRDPCNKPNAGPPELSFGSEAPSQSTAQGYIQLHEYHIWLQNLCYLSYISNYVDFNHMFLCLMTNVRHGLQIQ